MTCSSIITAHKQLVARAELQLLGFAVIRCACAGGVALTGHADGHGQGVALIDGALGVEQIVLVAARGGQQHGWHQHGHCQSLEDIPCFHSSSSVFSCKYSDGWGIR